MRWMIHTTLALALILSSACAASMLQNDADPELDCIYVEQTGSRNKHRVCRAKKMPEDEKRENQLQVERLQRQSIPVRE